MNDASVQSTIFIYVTSSSIPYTGGISASQLIVSSFQE
jgi:hypothetical protein